MKKIFIFFMFVGAGLFSMHSGLMAQDNSWVQQVIIGNGGLFEGSPPFNDFVTMERYDPITKVTNIFNTINTQSVQDIIIAGNRIYVAAQDSIVAYDADTYQRVAAVADSGLSRLGFYNNKLIVTKQFPIKRFFVEVLDAGNNLGLLARIANISGECGGVISTADSVYVAVNGGFLGTKGKIAVLNPVNWILTREINFDTAAKGMMDLYKYNGKIHTVNMTPFGSPNVGSLSTYDLTSGAKTTKVLNVKVGRSFGIDGNRLYLLFNGGVGSYNLDLEKIIDTTIVAEPGGPAKFIFLAGAVDSVNNRLYLNVGNETLPGIGVVTSFNGDSITSFSEGIAADAIALDIRTILGINNGVPANDFVVLYPNPANDFVFLKFNQNEKVTNTAIFNMTGQQVLNQDLSGTRTYLRIDCAQLPAGIYFLRLITENGIKTKKFIKK